MAKQLEPEERAKLLAVAFGATRCNLETRVSAFNRAFPNAQMEICASSLFGDYRELCVSFGDTKEKIVSTEAGTPGSVSMFDQSAKRAIRCMVLGALLGK